MTSKPKSPVTLGVIPRRPKPDGHGPAAGCLVRQNFGLQQPLPIRHQVFADHQACRPPFRPRFCRRPDGLRGRVPFARRFPKQLIEIGIAEQNLVGVAAGLASTGKNVFAVSPACFLTARSFEQIKADGCYSTNSVRLIGISAGVSYGALGSTHHSLHDFAALRTVHNLTIVAPADKVETEQAIRQAARMDSPVSCTFAFAKSSCPCCRSRTRNLRQRSRAPRRQRPDAHRHRRGGVHCPTSGPAPGNNERHPGHGGEHAPGQTVG